MAFFVHSWVMVVLAGLVALAGGPSCTSDRKADAVSCAHTLHEASPALACARCCLELGHLGYGYTGVEPKECQCD